VPWSEGVMGSKPPSPIHRMHNGLLGLRGLFLHEADSVYDESGSRILINSDGR